MRGATGADRVRDPKGPDNVRRHHERGGAIGVSTTDIEARGGTTVPSNRARAAQNPDHVGDDDGGKREGGVPGTAPTADIGSGVAPCVGGGGRGRGGCVGRWSRPRLDRRCMRRERGVVRPGSGVRRGHGGNARQNAARLLRPRTAS